MVTVPRIIVAARMHLSACSLLVLNPLLPPVGGIRSPKHSRPGYSRQVQRPVCTWLHTAPQMAGAYMPCMHQPVAGVSWLNMHCQICLTQRCLQSTIRVGYLVGRVMVWVGNSTRSKHCLTTCIQQEELLYTTMLTGCRMNVSNDTIQSSVCKICFHIHAGVV